MAIIYCLMLTLCQNNRAATFLHYSLLSFSSLYFFCFFHYMFFFSFGALFCMHSSKGSRFSLVILIQQYCAVKSYYNKEAFVFDIQINMCFFHLEKAHYGMLNRFKQYKTISTYSTFFLMISQGSFLLFISTYVLVFIDCNNYI